MIARHWHGTVPRSRADEYLRLMREVALPDYGVTAGNRGAWCLRRDDGDLTHFEMLTFWDDITSIKRFAGEVYERAKYYDFDTDFLTEMEQEVRHYSAYSE